MAKAEDSAGRYRGGLATSPTKSKPDSFSVLTSLGKLEESGAKGGVLWSRSFRTKILSSPQRAAWTRQR